ncbi:MAG: dockerin type I domain-containing protein, partial [Planctomycetota bacterium]
TMISGVYGFTRDVTVKASDLVGNVLQEWILPGEFYNTCGIASAELDLGEVPYETAYISADTDWTLRRRLPAVFDEYGVAEVNFSEENMLKGGDLDGDNWVSMRDFTYLQNAFGTSDPAADINGDGTVDSMDWLIYAPNMGATGDPE